MKDPLLDVPPDKVFWFCNSSCAANIYQFVDTIEHTNDGVFLYHVQNGRNDFADWIKNVLEDEQFYALIKEERNKYWFVQKARWRIRQLESDREQ